MSTKLFSGSTIFELKATHGIPFDISINEVLHKGITIEWASFIESARKNKWWDFQIIESIEHSLLDVDCDPEYRIQVLNLMKYYVMKHPHPMMK